MLKKASLIFYGLLVTTVVVWKVVEIEASYHSSGQVVPIGLARGTFHLLEFPSKMPTTRAVVIFCSGDGGWSGFEEEISLALQKAGYDVTGVDSYAYAQTDYNLAMLQTDLPLIIGGWSMGAEQVIAVAGGPKPPPGLVGLLLIDPCARGRYGVRLADQANVLPTGPGTFSMEDFSKTIGNLRVVQWHAANDTIDSRQWLDSLNAPHREYDFAPAGHFYNIDREEFLGQLVLSMEWILKPVRTEVMTAGGRS
jgi:hypothetical protein